MIAVLRLGHRPLRDKRITTHVALTSRAFGADGIYLTSDDRGVVESVERAVERWGGEFFIEVRRDWKKLLKSWRGISVHLTMYGLAMEEKLGEVKKHKDILIVVGAEKVPGEVFKLVDFNLAVGHQPHSEVSALAIFLDRVTSGEWARGEWFRGSLRVVPSERGKRLERD